MINNGRDIFVWNGIEWTFTGDHVSTKSFLLQTSQQKNVNISEIVNIKVAFTNIKKYL